MAESIARQLWRQAREGDRSAYEQLFALHQAELSLFIRLRLGTGLSRQIDPDEVLQDAYLSAHRSFEQFEYTADGAFLKWLCRIVENRIRDWNDHFRAEKRQAVPIPRSSPTGPVTGLFRAENRQQIELALQQLPEDQRLVLLLRYFEGLDSEAAGEQMGRTAGAIRKLTARALIELGRILKSSGQ